MEQYVKPLVGSKYEATTGIIPFAALAAGVAAVGSAIASAEVATAAAAGVAAGIKASPISALMGSKDKSLFLTRGMTLQEG